MQDQHPIQNHQPIPNSPSRSHLPLGIMAGLAAIAVAAGGGTALWTWNTVTSRTVEPVSPTAPTQVQPSSPQAANPVEEQTVQVYWLDAGDTQLELVPIQIELDQANTPDAALESAFAQLLDGPRQGDAFSAIPEGTELRDLSVESDGVHVDLSEAFTFGGGTASMTGRLAQVIYTATSLDADIPVWISVEGEPLEVLGGEGLMIDQPMTRTAFEDNFAL